MRKRTFQNFFRVSDKLQMGGDLCLTSMEGPRSDLSPTSDAAEVVAGPSQVDPRLPFLESNDMGVASVLLTSTNRPNTREEGVAQCEGNSECSVKVMSAKHQRRRGRPVQSMHTDKNVITRLKAAVHLAWFCHE